MIAMILNDVNDGCKLFGVSSAKLGLSTRSDLPLSHRERGANERSEVSGVCPVPRYDVCTGSGRGIIAHHFKSRQS